MSLELIRETFKLSQVIGEDTTQTVVENDIIVPDVKPDISRILLMDGVAFVKNVDVSHDKVRIDGTITYRILYAPDEAEQGVRSITTNAGFSCDLDVPNARDNMKCLAKCDVEHVDYTLPNSRKINSRTVLKVGGKVMDAADLEIANDLRGLEDVQVLREGLKVDCFLGDMDQVFQVKENMVVPAGKPAIREVLRSDVKIGRKDFSATDGKVVAKGDLVVSTLYIGDDESGSIQYMEHEIPFTQFADIPGMTENDRSEVLISLAGTAFEPQEDSDGEYRILSGDVGLSMYAAGYSSRQADIISDAYSLRYGVNLEKEPVRLEEAVTESSSQVVLREAVSVPAELPDIAEVFNVISKPSLSDYKIADNKLILEGVVTNSILYLSGNAQHPVSCLENETLFKYSADIKGIKPGMACDVELNVEHCTYSMLSATEVDVRLVVNAAARFYNRYSVPLVSRANEVPLDTSRSEDQPSLTIYFAQSGDTLWKIAKRYYTTIDEILKTNGLTGNEAIISGKQIFIPKKHI